MPHGICVMRLSIKHQTVTARGGDLAQSHRPALPRRSRRIRTGNIPGINIVTIIGNIESGLINFTGSTIEHLGQFCPNFLIRGTNIFDIPASSELRIQQSKPIFRNRSAISEIRHKSIIVNTVSIDRKPKLLQVVDA